MSTHTPGPWGLETVATSCGSCHKIGPFPGAGSRPEVHACVYADGIRIGRDESLPAAKELLANARLMAASPKMLALLQELVAIEGPQPGTADWAQKARAVIHEATEGAPQ